MEPGARTPPTEPLKSVSPVNTSPPTTKLSIPSVWPGRVERLDAQAAGLDGLPGLDRAVHVQQPGGLERVGHDLHAVALLPDVVLGHVVRVVVGEQQQARRPARAGRRPRAGAPTDRPSRSPRRCRPPRRPRGRRSRASPAAWSARRSSLGRSLVSARVDQLRREFPVFERKAYLNAGTNGPVPARAARGRPGRDRAPGARGPRRARRCSRGCSSSWAQLRARWPACSAATAPRWRSRARPPTA